MRKQKAQVILCHAFQREIDGALLQRIGIMRKSSFSLIFFLASNLITWREFPDRASITSCPALRRMRCRKYAAGLSLHGHL